MMDNAERVVGELILGAPGSVSEEPMFVIRNTRTGQYWLEFGMGTTPRVAEAHRYTYDETQRFASTDLEMIGVVEHDPYQAFADAMLDSAAIGMGVTRIAPEEVTVGDLNSSALGTGARKSAGKPDWSQLPWWVVPDIRISFEELRAAGRQMHWQMVLALLADWQRGTDFKLDQAAAMTLWLIHCETTGVFLYGDIGKTEKFPARALESTVRVLEFGEKKYKKGNWAKGMPWSVCFNSAMSHLTKLLAGEANDEESGLPHRDHLMCNLVFLLGYRSRYPEGDDRLPEFQHREDPNDLDF